MFGLFGLFDFLVIVVVGGIITDYFTKREKIKAGMLKDQIELEKLKHENYLLETEKMRIELTRLQIEEPKRNL